MIIDTDEDEETVAAKRVPDGDDVRVIAEAVGECEAECVTSGDADIELVIVPVIE